MCKRHPGFEIKNGIYFRAGDYANPRDWIPKNEERAKSFYLEAVKADEEKNYQRLAELTGPGQMEHSGESSDNSPFISVARCPLCLRESEDPQVKMIVAKNSNFVQLKISQRNSGGKPFVFDMGGDGVGAGETESLVLLPPDKSLIDYFEGYVTKRYMDSLAEVKSEGKGKTSRR